MFNPNSTDKGLVEKDIVSKSSWRSRVKGASPVIPRTLDGGGTVTVPSKKVTCGSPIGASTAALNRKLDNPPDYSQVPLIDTKQFAFEHQIDLDQEYGDIQPYSLLIDSRNRNHNCEDPGHYTISIPPVRYVNAIEFVGGKFPNPVYNIGKHNNCFYFQETPEQVKNLCFHKVELTPGGYNAIALATKLGEGMRDVGQCEYTVKIHPITNKFHIKTDDSIGTGIFNLIFALGREPTNDAGVIDQELIGSDKYCQPIRFSVKSIPTGSPQNTYMPRSIGPVMGFRPVNMVNELEYHGHNPFDPYPVRYLSMYVNDYERIHSVNKNCDGSFCQIALEDTTCCHNVHFRNIENIKYIKYFNPVLKEINKITIKFVDPDGNVYDFNGRDNQLIFELSTNFGPAILRKGDPTVARAGKGVVAPFPLDPSLVNNGLRSY